MINNYKALARELSEAKIVGLGEAYHFSGALHQEMKNLALELIKQKKHSSIFLENPKDKTRTINLWLMGQVELTKKQISHRLYRVWRTDDFLEFLYEIKKSNLNRKNKVQLFGIDIREPDEYIREILRRSPEEIQNRIRQLFSFSTIKSWRKVELRCLAKDKKAINKIDKDLFSLSLIEEECGVPLKAADAFRGIKSWLEYLSAMKGDYGKVLETRDLAMFQNFEALSASRVNDGIVLIGHAVHTIPYSKGVQAGTYDFKLKKMLGHRIHQKYKDKFKMVYFTANTMGGALDAAEDSIESALSEQIGFVKRRIILEELEIRESIWPYKKALLLSHFKNKPQKKYQLQYSSVFTLRIPMIRKIFDYLSFVHF